MCFGLLFFLGFLFLATQVLVGLYARSAVGAAAHDAGRIVASAAGADGVLDGPAELAPATARAERRVRDLLGADASFRLLRVDEQADVVEVEVTAPKPFLLFGGGTLGPDNIAGRAVIRLERLQ
jgi:hypothetical protein